MRLASARRAPLRRPAPLGGECADPACPAPLQRSRQSIQACCSARPLRRHQSTSLPQTGVAQTLWQTSASECIAPVRDQGDEGSFVPSQLSQMSANSAHAPSSSFAPPLQVGEVRLSSPSRLEGHCPQTLFLLGTQTTSPSASSHSPVVRFQSAPECPEDNVPQHHADATGISAGGSYVASMQTPVRSIRNGNRCCSVIVERRRNRNAGDSFYLGSSLVTNLERTPLQPNRIFSPCNCRSEQDLAVPVQRGGKSFLGVQDLNADVPQSEKKPLFLLMEGGNDFGEAANHLQKSSTCGQWLANSVSPSSISQENVYLRRNVEHLRQSKRQLEAQVTSLNERLQFLEQHNQQYKSLYEQSKSFFMCAGSGEMEIGNLHQQLSAVQLLKDALNTENVELRQKLQAAQSEDNKELKHTACVICMDNLANVVCLPCKHLALCSLCGQQNRVSSCPICRTDIEEQLQIFIP